MVEIYVRQNNVDQALRALKKKLQNEGILRDMKSHLKNASANRLKPFVAPGNWRVNVLKSKACCPQKNDVVNLISSIRLSKPFS